MNNFTLADVVDQSAINKLNLDLNERYKKLNPNGSYTCNSVATLQRAAYESTEMTFVRTLNVEECKQLAVYVKYILDSKRPLNNELLRVLEVKSALEGKPLPDAPISSFPVRASKRESLPITEAEVKDHFNGSRPIDAYTSWCSQTVEKSGVKKGNELKFIASKTAAIVRGTDKRIIWPIANVMLQSSELGILEAAIRKAKTVDTSFVKSYDVAKPWVQPAQEDWEQIAKVFGIKIAKGTNYKKQVIMKDLNGTEIPENEYDNYVCMSGKTFIGKMKCISSGFFSGAIAVAVIGGRIYSLLEKNKAAAQILDVTVRSYFSMVLSLGLQSKAGKLGYEFASSPTGNSTVVSTGTGCVWNTVTVKGDLYVFRSGSDTMVRKESRSGKLQKVKFVRLPGTQPIADIEGFLDEHQMNNERVHKALDLQQCLKCESLFVGDHSCEVEENSATPSKGDEAPALIENLDVEPPKSSSSSTSPLPPALRVTAMSEPSPPNAESTSPSRNPVPPGPNTKSQPQQDPPDTSSTQEDEEEEAEEDEEFDFTFPSPIGVKILAAKTTEEIDAYVMELSKDPVMSDNHETFGKRPSPSAIVTKMLSETGRENIVQSLDYLASISERWSNQNDILKLGLACFGKVLETRAFIKKIQDEFYWVERGEDEKIYLLTCVSDLGNKGDYRSWASTYYSTIGDYGLNEQVLITDVQDI